MARRWEVSSSMKAMPVLAVALAALLVTDAPPVKDGARGKLEPSSPGVGVLEPARAGRLLADTVAELQAAQSVDRSRSHPSAGELWIQVNRLKREGQNTRQIEWYLTDLEGSLRRGPQDAGTRRHLLNNLSHEIELVRRRAGAVKAP
jgi:hypothetical protein